MLKSRIYFEAICDHCGRRLSFDGLSEWECKEDAVRAMTYMEWKEISSGEVYCKDCQDSSGL